MIKAKDSNGLLRFGARHRTAAPNEIPEAESNYPSPNPYIPYRAASTFSEGIWTL